MAVAGALASPVGAADAPRVRYFKDVLPTTVAADRVAVQLREGADAPWSNGHALNGLMALDPNGLGAPGWTQCVFHAADRGRIDGVLAADPGVLCVSPVLLDESNRQRVPTSRLIVAFDAATSAADADAIVAREALGEVIERNAFGLPNTYLIETHRRDGAEVLRLADRVTDLPAVRFAESDALIEAVPLSIPNDPLFESAWGLHNTGQSLSFCSQGQTNGFDADIDGPEAWDLATGDSSVIVVVIDNGMQFDHPDLLANPALGFDPTGQNGGGFPVLACDNHGTAVGGCIAATADNGIGVAGIASGVSLASVRISTVGPSCSGWTVQGSWLAGAMVWSMAQEARITNTSWSFGVSGTITFAYEIATQAGILHFASSGNGSSSNIAYPASLPTVVAVGATNSSGALAWFSNSGEDQELVAPGAVIVTTDRTGAAGYSDDDYTCINGTSFSSPMAAGVGALMMSVNPSLTAAQVRTLIKTSATDIGAAGWDSTFGWGQVNARRAVLAAEHPGDLDFSGHVDSADLALLLGVWNDAGPHGDLNGDGIVNALDLSILLGDWNR